MRPPPAPPTRLFLHGPSHCYLFHQVPTHLLLYTRRYYRGSSPWFEIGLIFVFQTDPILVFEFDPIFVFENDPSALVGSPLVIFISDSGLGVDHRNDGVQVVARRENLFGKVLKVRLHVPSKIIQTFAAASQPA